MIRSIRSGLFDAGATALSRQQSALSKVQERAMTGLSINRPSDAPDRLAEVHRLRAANADQVQWSANAERAEGLLSATDLALGSVTDLLAEARQFTVNMLSETHSAATRATQAQRASQFREALIELANSDIDGRYLFAGSDYGDVAFDPSGVYQGDTDIPSMEVGAATSVEVGADGSDVFQGAVDVFAVMDALGTALQTNDTAGLQAVLADIDAAVEQVIGHRVRLGGHADVAEDALEVSTGLQEIFGQRMDELTTADPAATYTELAELQGSYQATLQVVAKGARDSLFELI